MKVLVVGCGRIGSPLLTWLAHRNKIYPGTFTSIAGVDVDPNLINKKVTARFKENRWPDILKSLGDDVPMILSYTEAGNLGPQDVIIVTCGTPVDKNQNPDTAQIISALNALYENHLVHPNSLLILRSTIFPGGTLWIRDYMRKNWRFSPDIVMAPERIAEGHTFDEIDQIPQIIGAESIEEFLAADEFFKKRFGSIETIYLSPSMGGTKAAELAKLMCNTWRYVQFATANEFAMLCDEFGADFLRVRDACNRGYWRGGIPSAALNVGGPCLGKDAKILSSYSKNAQITNAAYDVAEKTVTYYLRKIHPSDLINVGVLGLAFKKNSDNNMNSLSYKLIKHLEILGTKKIRVYDPYIQHRYSTSLEEVFNESNIIFVMTEHDQFRDVELQLKDLAFKPGTKVIRL